MSEFRKSPALRVFAYLGLGDVQFPYLESLCAEIAAKHPKLPIYAHQMGTAIYMVLPDYIKALDDAEKWLTENYATELARSVTDVQDHPSYIAAMNHGGSLGQDYFFWNGEQGRCINRTYRLCSKYQIAHRIREKEKAAQAAAEAKRLAEIKRTEEKYERIIEQRVKDRLEAIERQRRFEEEERKRMEIQAQIDTEVERRVRLALGAPPTTKPVEKSVAPSPKVGGGAAMPVPATKPAEPNTLAHGYAKHGIGNVCEVYEPPSVPVINWNVVEVCED